MRGSHQQLRITTPKVEALKAAGCERIYSEKASGAARNGRPQLAKLLKALSPGDVMVVTKIDRVARSALDLLHIVRTEIGDREAGFVSLGDSWCDTTNEMGRFMLTVMSGIAELERDLIRKRLRSRHCPCESQGETVRKTVGARCWAATNDR
jgi:DNA invertase Pin-like site-specific DNA recombinase